MTYNEWRDELKNNLLSVSENERKRVLDYYAEAYADRREAGFSEHRIIEEFGAPYDAAQKILSASADENADGFEEYKIEARNIYGQPPRHTLPEPQPEKPAPKAKKKRKKRTAAIVISVISAILLLGLIFFITLRIISCSVRASFTEAHYTQQAESIENIEIDFAVGEVETVFYDGDKIEIEYHTSNIYNVRIDEKGGTLRYKLSTKWWLMLGGTIDYPKTTIKLPTSCIYNLDIDMSAGSAVINGGIFGNLKIDLSAGKVTLSGETVCSSLDIDASAGSVDINKIECAGSVNIDLSAGKVDIDSVTCPKIYIDLSAGSVKLGIVGQQSEYNIAVDKSAGSCNVGNQTGNDSNKILDIDLSAGSVTVTFKS